MNKKQFEIYKNWRTKKYERDLEKKQDEMAVRGLASSSIRNKEEKWLKEELEADLGQKESEALEHEEAKTDDRKTSRNQRITSIILASISILSFFGVIYFSYQQNKINEKLLEQNLKTQQLEFEYDFENKTATFKNYGEIPIYVEAIRVVFGPDILTKIPVQKAIFPSKFLQRNLENDLDSVVLNQFLNDGVSIINYELLLSSDSVERKFKTYSMGSIVIGLEIENKKIKSIAPGFSLYYYDFNGKANDFYETR
ncbi:MAG: hypothetical protein JW740_01670 [Candidatus Zambryskibacteria bacterium]|nr:hypothetical protein [Candidatus Zambryskibacteria bacterium]